MVNIVAFDPTGHPQTVSTLGHGDIPLELFAQAAAYGNAEAICFGTWGPVVAAFKYDQWRLRVVDYNDIREIVLAHPDSECAADCVCRQ